MGLRNPAVFVRSHNRENLFIEVTQKQGIDKDIQTILKMCNNLYTGRSGIIYCRTKKSCQTVHDKLLAKGKTNIAVFTGDMTIKEKTAVLEQWLSEEIQLVIATVAFGLGINKTDCRFVIHYDLPGSIEAYYQAIGRAGRDGIDSHCLMFFDYKDIRKQDTMSGENPKSY